MEFKDGLKKTVQKKGRAILSEPALLDAYLSDYVPEDPLVIAFIVQASQMHCFDELTEASRTVNLSAINRAASSMSKSLAPSAAKKIREALLFTFSITELSSEKPDQGKKQYRTEAKTNSAEKTISHPDSATGVRKEKYIRKNADTVYAYNSNPAVNIWQHNSNQQHIQLLRVFIVIKAITLLLSLVLDASLISMLIEDVSILLWVFFYLNVKKEKHKNASFMYLAVILWIIFVQYFIVGNTPIFSFATLTLLCLLLSAVFLIQLADHKMVQLWYLIPTLAAVGVIGNLNSLLIVLSYYSYGGLVFVMRIILLLINTLLNPAVLFAYSKYLGTRK